MDNPRMVLAATDLSDPADEALRQAHEYAMSTGAELSVCFVEASEASVHPLFPHLGREEVLHASAARERATEVLAGRVRQVTGRPPGTFRVLVDDGSPAAVIVRLAERLQVERIVVGSHGLTGLSRMLIGSVALSVVRHAHCPVLVARPRLKTGKILVGTDFSDPALPALRAAAEEARRTGARVTLAHCLEESPMWTQVMEGTVVGWEPAARLRDKEHAAAEKKLEEALALCGVEGDRRLLAGPAGTALIGFSQDLGAELVVVGTIGRTGLPRLLLGSVAEMVVRGAPCPVLVVRLHRAEPPQPSA